MKSHLGFLPVLLGACAHQTSAYCDRLPKPRLSPVISVRAETSQRGLSVLILDRVSNAPIRGAQVVIATPSLILVADSNGLAQSSTMLPGLVSFSVRFIGYLAVRDSITISEHFGRFRIIQLLAQPICIDERGLGPP